MLLVQYGQTAQQQDLFESSEYVPYLMILHSIVFLIIHFCDLRMAHSGRNMSS